MARLELSLLGGLRASVDGSPVTGFDKTRALLAYLAIEATRPHPREELAALLWPELPEEAARRNLRNSLFQLRGALGEGEEEGAPGWLLVTARTVQLDTAADHEVDVAKFTRLLAACDAHRHRHVERCATCHAWLEEAATLYRGDLLRGFYLPDCAAFEEWLVLRRERLHRQACQALARLATYHDGRGELAPALEYTFRQLELEPWREEAYRQAMRLLALSGQRSAALAQYETCRQVLATELDAEPDSETTALYERLRAGELPGDGSYPLAFAPRHNLQPQLTPFIGREAELRLLIERLDSPDYRLITVVGPGGRARPGWPGRLPASRWARSGMASTGSPWPRPLPPNCFPLASPRRWASVSRRRKTPPRNASTIWATKRCSWCSTTSSSCFQVQEPHPPHPPLPPLPRRPAARPPIYCCLS